MFYLSFVDEEKWLGGLYIEAEDFGQVVLKLYHTEQNPGGEVVIVQCPLSLEIKLSYVGRLLTKEELRKAEVYTEEAALVNLKGEII
jgi:hypothetical protein